MWEVVLADEDGNRFVAAAVCLFDSHRGSPILRLFALCRGRGF